MGTTPLLQQFFRIKEQHPNTILLFQVGDFYELFFEDAKEAAAFLGIALTKRGTHQGNPVPLCGVPMHTLDHYLVKLVKGGYRVAVCDQLEPAQAGRVVERGVTQVLTPGTLTDLKLLDDKSASYCASVMPMQEGIGCLFVELLTGQIFVCMLASNDTVQLEAELRRFSPDEVLLPTGKLGEQLDKIIRRQGYDTTVHPQQSECPDFVAWFSDCHVPARDILERSSPAMGALQLLHTYLDKNQAVALGQCKTVHCYSPDDFLMLDAGTQFNLELVRNTYDGSARYTLFWVLDQAVTPMGSRTIKKWLTRPLLNQNTINQRHDAVQVLFEDFGMREGLRRFLKECGDVERVIGRIALGRAQLHDYCALLGCIRVLPDIKHLLSSSSGMLAHLVQRLKGFDELGDLLESSFNEDSARVWKIKPGYSAELDAARHLTDKGSQAIAAFEKGEQGRTGINSLKVKHNKVHGYSIEITKANTHLVPDEYRKTQTLVNRERFTTQTLQDLAYDIAHAEAKALELEEEIYTMICAQVADYIAPLRKMAQAIAQCDVLCSFATVAHAKGYVRPEIHAGRDICIQNGKHPVVACLEDDFIPNNVTLTKDERTWIITGPNMGGKSTFLRQIALICIMAQSGSFVPATSAQLPILDRIFTRIGAADRVSQGKSTFLVEMEETALICNQATDKSLVILDEVGRGTSTHDGMAIAQAVLEYLHEKVQARALFATHYHELTALDATPGIVAYHTASKQSSQGIVLLHKIIKGTADSSFGIEVARRVQLPVSILQQAEKLVTKSSSAVHTATEVSHGYAHNLQQKNVALQQEIVEKDQKIKTMKMVLQRLQKLDYNELSPKKAFDILWEVKEKDFKDLL